MTLMAVAVVVVVEAQVDLRHVRRGQERRADVPDEVEKTHHHFRRRDQWRAAAAPAAANGCLPQLNAGALLRRRSAKQMIHRRCRSLDKDRDGKTPPPQPPPQKDEFLCNYVAKGKLQPRPGRLATTTKSMASACADVALTLVGRSTSLACCLYFDMPLQHVTASGRTSCEIRSKEPSAIGSIHLPRHRRRPSVPMAQQDAQPQSID